MLCSVKDCHCPIDEQKQQRKKVEGKFVCDVCFDMYCAIYERQWFIKAQVEYRAEVKRINRLKNGGDYLQ